MGRINEIELEKGYGDVKEKGKWYGRMNRYATKFQGIDSRIEEQPRHVGCDVRADVGYS